MDENITNQKIKNIVDQCEKFNHFKLSDIFDYSPRIHHCLRLYKSVTTLGELLQLTEKDIVSTPHLGQKSLMAIKEILNSFNPPLKLKPYNAEQKPNYVFTKLPIEILWDNEIGEVDKITLPNSIKKMNWVMKCDLYSDIISFFKEKIEEEYKKTKNKNKVSHEA
jgi:hypothetical protein